MKVLYISPQIPYPLTDGGKISIYSTLKCLNNLGYDIDFFAYAKQTDKTKAKEFLENICKCYFLDIDTPYTIWGALKNLFSDLSYNIEKYHRYEILDNFDDYLIYNKPELIFLNNIHMAWLIDYFRLKLPAAKIFLREENFEAYIMKRYYQNTNNLFLKLYSFIQYRRLLKYETSITEKFDSVIMISKEDENIIKSFNPNINTFVLPSAVDTEFEKKDIIQEKYSLAHVGSLSWEPNYHSLLWFIDNVLPMLKKQYPNFKLYVYGNLAKRKIPIPNDLQDNIIIKGFVEDIRNEVLSKSTLVVPLQVGSGIRIKILEFMAWGSLIITTDIGKEGIDVKHNNELLIANTPEEFVTEISKVFENKINFNDITQNARNFVKNNYSFDVVSQKLQNIISNTNIRVNNGK